MSRQDIENAEKTWVEAFNAGDAQGVAACYTNDGRLHPPNYGLVTGRPDLATYVQTFLDTGAKITFDLIDVHEAHDICAAVGSYDLAFPTGDHDKGKFIEVWTRQKDGSWLLADDIFNSSLPVPAG